MRGVFFIKFSSTRLKDKDFHVEKALIGMERID